jgi:hypothetical protein
MPRPSFITWLENCFVAEPQDAAVFIRQVAQKCSVEMQRVIAVILKIFPLQRDVRIVVSKEDSLARL